MAPLDAALATLLARTGAQAARVVDGRSGAVVAHAGVDAGDDVATLVAIARESGPVAAGCDLVVATGHAVHVLRSAGTAGTFLHVRLAHGRGDVPTARRELASPALDAAVRHAVDPRSEPSAPGSRPGPVPLQRPAPGPRDPTPGSLPVPRDTGGHPALATLGAAARSPARVGVLAALALAPADVPGPTPRTDPAGPVPLRAVLDRPWSCDTGTLHRVATGLRALE